MSLSFTDVEYLGGPQVFPTNFALGILEIEHIKVTSKTEVDGLGDPLEYTFSYNTTTGDVTVISTLLLNEVIRIARVVPKDSLYVEFVSSDITPKNVDNTIKQAMMSVHEIFDQEEANRAIAQGALDTVTAFEAEATTILSTADAAKIAAIAAQAAAEAARDISVTESNSATASAAAAAASEAAADIDALSADADAASAAVSAGTATTKAAEALASANSAATSASTATTKASEASVSAAAADLDAAAALASELDAEAAAVSAAASAAAAATFDPALYVTKSNPELNGSVTGTALADQATAEAGTDAAKLMTPLRTAQAITALTPPSALSEFYESSQQTITSGGQVILFHGLSADPKLLQYRLVCVAAEDGYNPGDVLDPIMSFNAMYSASTAITYGASVRSDVTNILIRYGSNGSVFAVLNSATGGLAALINTNWRLIVRAWA